MDKLSNNVLLAGCILMANFDWAGIAGYALKAVIGGGIWLVYKLTADRIERTRQKKQ